MKKVGLVFLFIVVAFVNAIGCLNDFVLKDGTIITNDGSYSLESGNPNAIPTGHKFIGALLPSALKRLDSLWKVTNDIDYFSDYALVLILQGKYEDGKNSYLEIEKIKPGRYATASNLGTVYELLGDDKNALKWIKKAIKINPGSHHDSEWLHVKILEAKIKGETFVTSDFLLNTNFGNATIPTSNLSKDELWNLKITLVYQLNERMTFIKPENKIMAQLLFDLGNVFLLEENKENALTVYKMAKEYGYSNSLLSIRMNYLKQKLATNAMPSDPTGGLDEPAVQTIDGNTTYQTPPASDADYTLFYILGLCTSILSISIFFFFKRNKEKSTID